MSDTYVDRLIMGYLDNDLTGSEHAEIESLMLRSEAARHRFWKLAEVHGLAREAVQIAWPEEGDRETASASEQNVISRKASTYSRRRLSLLVLNRSVLTLTAGVVIGIISAGAAWAIALAPRQHVQHDLLSESFEAGSAPETHGVPVAMNLWSGDFTEVVGEEQGVRPASGNRMLKHLRADYLDKPMPEGSYCADLYRLVDLRPFRNQLAEGVTIAQLTASCNMGTCRDNERYTSSVGLYALTSEMASSSNSLLNILLTNDSLAMARKYCRRLDCDPKSWQQIDCQLQIPADTEVLLIHFSFSQPEGSNPRIDFEGHYLDDLHLSLSHHPQ